MQQDIQNGCWSGIEKLTFRFVFACVLCFISCISFPHSFIPDIGKYTGVLWQPLINRAARHLLHVPANSDLQVRSDSTGMYIAAVMALCVAALATTAWTIADSGRHSYNRVYYWFRVFISYYLAMQLMLYGADKVFKAQFYLPEPNTLYTTLGSMPRDLLYWSTMGISRPYSIFLGATEIICAGLLLFRRTRTAGALLALAMMANIIAINFCFDISVKLYSLFLLLLTIILLWPAAISGLRTHRRYAWRPMYTSKHQWVTYTLLKAIVIILICADSTWGYISNNAFNDDNIPRPYLHGAYHVTRFIHNGDTLLPLETDAYRWRRMFIHRRGYLIAQHMNDEMQDYTLTYDTANKYLMISDAHNTPQGLLQYTQPGDTALVLHGNIGSDSVDIYMDKLDERHLRIFSRQFHWHSDD